MISMQIVKEWLDKADSDFMFAQVNLKENEQFFAQINFFFQQAAEKYLKAYIVAYELEFAKIHDLTRLLEICEENDSSFSVLREDCEMLTKFYIDTRYPVHWPTIFDQTTTRQAEGCVLRIGNFIKSKIGK